MEDCRRRPAPSAASNYRGRSLWYWILSSGSVPVSSESGLALRIAFAILPDPPGFRWIRDGRGMIEAAEDAALTGHWLRCEHSRSAMDGMASGSGSGPLKRSGARPAPSAASNYRGRSRRLPDPVFRIRPASSGSGGRGCRPG